MNFEKEKFLKDLEKYSKQIKESLYEAMRKLLLDIEQAETVGVALSGGIDSTIVAYLLKKLKKDNIIAFTLHTKGYEAENRDIDAAKKVSSYLNLKHEIVYVSSDEIIKAVEPVISLITAPGRNVHDFNVYGGIVMYLLGQEIKKFGIKKCFGGEGLDELCGSYSPSGSFQYSHDKMIENEMRKKLFINLTERGYANRTTLTLGKYGIEARSPYLDKNFAEIMLSIPSEFFKDDWKLPIIEAFKDEIPINYLKRHKTRAQVGSGVFKVLQDAGYDQKKLEEIWNKIKN